jgi:hypothetical protein
MLKGALDAAELKRRLRNIEDTVESLGQYVEEVLLIDLRAAYKHLETAQRAANEELRRSELASARASFVRLAEHPSASVAVSGARTISNEQRAAFGHLGSFYYLLLLDDPRQALMEAYSCAERFPLLGIDHFPAAIFSGDYGARIEAIRRHAIREQELASAAYVQEMTGYRQERRGYAKEMAWKVPLAAGAFLAGLAGAVVSPSMAARGAQAAGGILAGTGSRSVVPPTRPRLATVNIEEPETKALMEQVRTEAAQRRAALERG